MDRGRIEMSASTQLLSNGPRREVRDTLNDSKASVPTFKSFFFFFLNGVVLYRDIEGCFITKSLTLYVLTRLSLTIVAVLKRRPGIMRLRVLFILFYL